MSEKATREQIVEAADQLLYEKGFEYTSFGDLAKKVGISRGNVTFHFATRDDILAAVIDRRLDRTKQMLERWEAERARPEQRIKSFINILIVNRTKIMLYGCPVGTLCTELAKLEHPALPRANGVFGLFRDWLGAHFVQLGFRKNADALALHVLTWSQGVATLASAIRDEGFVRREVRQLEDWLDQLIKGKSGK
jgi:TetR/AcrR family transcriptional regulator, transcriptional repressor for nem operon